MENKKIIWWFSVAPLILTSAFNGALAWGCPELKIGYATIDVTELTSERFCKSLKEDFDRRESQKHLNTNPASSFGSYCFECTTGRNMVELIQQKLNEPRPTTGAIHMLQADFLVRTTNATLIEIQKDRIKRQLSESNIWPRATKGAADIVLLVEEILSDEERFYRSSQYSSNIVIVEPHIIASMREMMVNKDLTSSAVQRLIRRSQFDLPHPSLEFVKRLRLSLLRDEFIRRQYGPLYSLRPQLIKFVSSWNTYTASEISERAKNLLGEIPKIPVILKFDPLDEVEAGLNIDTSIPPYEVHSFFELLETLVAGWNSLKVPTHYPE